MSIDKTLTRRELAHDLLHEMRIVLRDESAISAELHASALCVGWYLTAPDFPREGRAAHPFGNAPALPTMRVLREQLDAVDGYDDEALALTRTLRSFDAGDAELCALAASAEQLLATRGATAPAWSEQLDAWELTEAWEVNERGDDDALGRRLCVVMGWRHANGEEHCLVVTSDPSNFGDIVSIAVDPFLREVVADLRRGIEEFGDDTPLALTAVPASQAAIDIRWSIRKTYEHAFRSLVGDVDALAVFALLEARAQRLP